MSEFDALSKMKALVEETGQSRFFGPIGPLVIQKCEKELGTSVFGMYRDWIQAVGGGVVKGIEVFALFERTVTEVPDAAGLTLDARGRGLPQRFLIIGESGMGEWYVLDLGMDGEPPVLLWSTISGGLVPEVRFENFYRYLASQAKLDL